MSTLITVLHVIVCLFLMLTVLLQSGKGGGMGALGGGAGGSTVFGGSGASSFLKRATAIAGTIFMVTSMVLAFLSSRGSNDALDRFAREQDEMAAQKEKLKIQAIRAKKKGTTPGAGSADGPSMTPLTPVTPPDSGSAGAGSAGAAGSAADPEAPLTPAPTPDPAKPAAPTPATPADPTPATPAAPATPKPGAPTP